MGVHGIWEGCPPLWRHLWVPLSRNLLLGLRMRILVLHGPWCAVFSDPSDAHTIKEKFYVIFLASRGNFGHPPLVTMTPVFQWRVAKVTPAGQSYPSWRYLSAKSMWVWYEESVLLLPEFVFNFWVSKKMCILVYSLALLSEWESEWVREWLSSFLTAHQHIQCLKAFE